MTGALAGRLVTDSARSRWAQRRVTLAYLWRHGRLPDLAAAPRFTEMVQRRKLFDRDLRLIPLMDKVAAKRTVARTLGPEWVTPTIWHGLALPERPIWPTPIIVKARHGCNQYAVLRHKPSIRRWSALRERALRWVERPYGRWLDEWAYESVPRGVIVEPLLGDGSALPIDYKIYVFGGQATHVQVHLGRGEKHRWTLHDRAFRPLVGSNCPVPAPRSLRAMLAAAEALGAGFDFIRIDFYEVDGAPRFGEFCLYPGSGLDPFAADWIDFALGALWHEAGAPRSRVTTGS